MSSTSFLDLSFYQLLYSIGSGNFSKVYRVKKVNSDEFYAAKVSNFMVDEETKDAQETLLLFREINLLSFLNHPSILKFIGYSQTDFSNDPRPTIITEFATNGSLREIIELESSSLSPDEWNITKKLINIYGIASGMAYLHKNNVIHRDLKPENILIDDYLYPKIADFGLSKITDILSMSMNIQSQKGLKGTPMYMAPEIFTEENYTKSADVYAFSFIVYQLLTAEIPFQNFTLQKIFKMVVSQGYRPEIREDIPNSYRELIEKCWSQIPDERPSFEQIIDDLKNNPGYITELVDEEEFFDYVDYIDNYQSTFDVSKRIVHFDDFIKVHGRKKVVRKVTIKEIDQMNKSIFNEDATKKEEKQEKINNKLLDTNNSENEKSEENSCNEKHSEEESKVKEQLIKELHIDENNSEEERSEEESKVKEQLIKELHIDENNSEEERSEEENKVKEQIKKDDLIKTSSMSLLSMSKNVHKIKIKEFENEVDESSVNKKDLIYPKEKFEALSKEGQTLVQQAVNDADKQFLVGKYLIEGTNGFPKDYDLGLDFLYNSVSCGCLEAIIYYAQLMIDENIETAKHYIGLIPSTDPRLYYLNGKVFKKEKNDSEATKYYEKGAKAGNVESIYKYAKALFYGEGIKRNTKEAIKYFNLSKSQGHKKSIRVLDIISQYNTFKGFKDFNVETQKYFISYSARSSNDDVFESLVIKGEKTEMLFFNNSFKSPIFHDFLSEFRNLQVFISFPSSAFSSIISLLIKIKRKKIDQLFIFVNICDIVPFPFILNGKAIYAYLFDDKISIIPENAFKKNSTIKRVCIDNNIKEIKHNAFSQCSNLELVLCQNPGSIKYISNNCFYKSQSLHTIELPSSVESICDFAFEECKSLSIVTFGKSNVKKIGRSAFSNCTSLQQITIPSSVQEISMEAFKGCKSLIQVEFQLPCSLLVLEFNLFEGCKSLYKISIPSSITTINPYCFKKSGISEITFDQNSSLDEIYYNAFEKCNLLTQIIIPSSVSNLYNNSFIDCLNLERVIIDDSSNIDFLKTMAFNGCFSLKEIIVPKHVKVVDKLPDYKIKITRKDD